MVGMVGRFRLPQKYPDNSHAQGSRRYFLLTPKVGIKALLTSDHPSQAGRERGESYYHITGETSIIPKGPV